MTEIKIEKKKLLWPWILLGLGLIAVIIYLLFYYGNDGKSNEVIKTSELNSANETELKSANETDLISVKENNSTVATYVSFVETGKNKMGLDHVYTNAALLKLIEATDAIAGEVGYDVQADLEKAKEYAEMITEEPFETSHADNIKRADAILAKALQNIQKAKYPGLTNEVAELKNASESIKPGVLTLNQKDEVKDFFNKAAELLKKMN